MGEIAHKDDYDRFVGNPDNLCMVSFPRTGSHWLRMLLEVYTERPVLPMTFHWPGSKNYLFFPTHDIDLKAERRNVLYLYRNPVETIYSQMGYYSEDTTDETRIRHWADLYGRHLDKWLFQEKFTQKKFVIRYESLKYDASNAFSRLCSNYGFQFDVAKFTGVLSRITKELVQEKAAHDPKVMNLTEGYSKTRGSFSDQYSGMIWESLLNGRAHVIGAFSTKP